MKEKLEELIIKKDKEINKLHQKLKQEEETFKLLMELLKKLEGK